MKPSKSRYDVTTNSLRVFSVCVLLASTGYSSAANVRSEKASAPSADFPLKPVRVMVPQTPGSSADFFARLIGEMLSEKWKVPVVIDNRSGAGGIVAMDAVAKSNADGYTLAMTTEGTVAILPHLYKNL